MGITWSQGNKKIIAAVTGTTLAFTNAVNRGDLLVCAIRAGTGGTGVTLSDNINGSWPANDANNGANAAFLFHFPNSAAASAGGLTITVAATNSATIRMIIDAFTGCSGALATAATAGTTAATTALACTATASVGAGNLVYGGFLTSGVSETFTVGTSQGVTCVADETISDATLGSGFSEHVLSSAAGTQAPSCTASGSFATSVVCGVFLPSVSDALWQASQRSMRSPILRM
jgi:hypothetical protein